MQRRCATYGVNQSGRSMPPIPTMLSLGVLWVLLLSSGTAKSFGGGGGRRVLGWLDPSTCSNGKCAPFSPKQWDRMLGTLERHRANITIISGSMYQIVGEGAMAYYDDEMGAAMARGWMSLGAVINAHVPARTAFVAVWLLYLSGSAVFIRRKMRSWFGKDAAL